MGFFVLGDVVGKALIIALHKAQLGQLCEGRRVLLFQSRKARRQLRTDLLPLGINARLDRLQPAKLG